MPVSGGATPGKLFCLPPHPPTPPSVVKAVLFKRKKKQTNNFLYNILYLKLVVG